VFSNVCISHMTVVISIKRDPCVKLGTVITYMLRQIPSRAVTISVIATVLFNIHIFIAQKYFFIS